MGSTTIKSTHRRRGRSDGVLPSDDSQHEALEHSDSLSSMLLLPPLNRQHALITPQRKGVVTQPLTDDPARVTTSLPEIPPFQRKPLTHPHFRSEQHLKTDPYKNNIESRPPDHPRAKSAAVLDFAASSSQQTKPFPLEQSGPSPSLLIPVVPPASDHLRLSQHYASDLLYWQYIAAYSGLGVFGRRAITTAFIVCSLATAFSLGAPLYVILGMTVILMAVDITYISMFGHKDRYTIKRSQLKFYQAEVEYWSKGNKHDPKFADLVKFTKTLRITKEDYRIALVHYNKINKIEDVLESGWSDNDQNFSPSAIAKTVDSLAAIYCPDLDKSTEQNEKITALHYAINQERQTLKEEVDRLNADLCIRAEKLKEDRLSQPLTKESLIALKAEINQQNQNLFQPYFDKLSKTENEQIQIPDSDPNKEEEENKQNASTKLEADRKALRKTLYQILSTDALVRRLLVECEIDADLIAEQYRRSKTATLESFLSHHYRTKSAVYEFRYSKRYSAQRTLTFGQFLKVGFRSFSLGMVILTVLYEMGVYAPAHFAPILYIAAGITAFGLILGYGNAYVQRNKEDLINLYSNETNQFKEFERRDKFICLIQIIDRKLYYSPTRKLDDKIKRSKEIAALKKEFCYKIFPIFLLAGTFARRSLNLTKLSRYIPVFHNELAVSVILSGLMVFLVYDLILSMLNIHKKHHTLDMYEQKNPLYASDNPHMQVNDILDTKINEKLNKFMAYKNDPKASFHALGDMEKPLTSILGDEGVAERMIKKLAADYDSAEELKQALYAVLDQDPRLPEQYKDSHPQRDIGLEKLEALQVFKPTFRIMSAGGSVTMLAPHSHMGDIAITTVMSAIGVPILFDIPVFLGAIIGAIIGFVIGVWLYKLDMKEDKVLHANTETPDVYHRTLVRRMVNDILDSVLLNSFTAPKPNDSLSTKRPFRIRTATPFAAKPAKVFAPSGHTLPEYEARSAAAMGGGY